MNVDEAIEVIRAYRFKRIKTARHRGDKISPKCPRCGEFTFGYHEGGGRFKDCDTCGFDNYWEDRVHAVKFEYRKDPARARAIRLEWLIQIADYVKKWTKRG